MEKILKFLVSCGNLSVGRHKIPPNSFCVDFLQLSSQLLNLGSRKLLIANQRHPKPDLRKLEPTFVLVFARDIERSIEINFSCTPCSSGVSLPSLLRSWSRRPWQTSNRFDRRVTSFGEYDESVAAFFTMPLSFSIVWVRCSKSFAEYKSTSRRCCKSSLIVDVKA
jgi:hypothetical protein